MPRPLLVVGAVIVDDLDRPTRLLAARRRTGAPATIGRWEFPGGKVEPGESPQEDLRRELAEELAVETVIGAEVGDGAGWRITDRLSLRLFAVRVVDSTVVAGSDHDELRWLGADELAAVDWLESDRSALPFVRALLGGASSDRGDLDADGGVLAAEGV